MLEGEIYHSMIKQVGTLLYISNYVVPAQIDLILFCICNEYTKKRFHDGQNTNVLVEI